MLGGVQVNVGGVQNMLGGCTNEVGGCAPPQKIRQCSCIVEATIVVPNNKVSEFQH